MLRAKLYYSPTINYLKDNIMENISPQEKCCRDISKGSASPEKQNRNTKKYVLSGIFLLALTAVTFYIIFKDNSIEEIFSLLKNVKIIFVIGGAMSMLCYIVVQGLIIGMAAKCIRAKLRLREMIQYSCIGFFYSGVTPSSTGGQPMQFYYMCRDRMSPSKVTLVMFITNISYQIAVVLIGLSMFIFKLKYLVSVSGSIIVAFFIGISINLFILFILAGVLFSESLLKKMLKGIVSFLNKIRIIKKPEKVLRGIDKYLDEFSNGVKLIKANRKRFFMTLLATVVQLLFYYIVPYFVYKAFGLSGYSFFDIVAINAILFVAVSMFPLPGSVGAAESGFLLLFGPIFSAAIMPSMLLSRFINFYTMMIISGIVSAYAHLRKPYCLPKNYKK